MITLYYKPLNKTCQFSKIEPKDSIILCSKERSLARIHWSMLRPFKLSDGSYMMSEDLLMVIARIFKIDFEDLWNIIHLNDQIDLITSRCSHTRTNDDIDGLIMNIDV